MRTFSCLILNRIFFSRLKEEECGRAPVAALRVNDARCISHELARGYVIYRWFGMKFERRETDRMREK